MVGIFMLQAKVQNSAIKASHTFTPVIKHQIYFVGKATNKARVIINFSSKSLLIG